MQYLQTNTTLQGGKYRIERVLGQGGFGITYLATQLSLQREVAIKEFFMKEFCSRDEATLTMSTPTTGSSRLVEQYRKKFIKEARNLARLNHPHIISVIEVFEENDTVYYVMPYLAGGSLQDYVKMHGLLSEQEAMKYVKQIACALKYMHEEKHICHFDVKPANILLDDKGNAVLIDFGISKNYDAKGEETTTTPVGVSEGYAPIEQYQQKVEEFSPVSDVYALGATLYFLLHGKKPVSATNRASGTALLMSKRLSQGVKDIINVSMKISKIERASSVDVFMRNIVTSARRESAFVEDGESTIIEGVQRAKKRSISVNGHEAVDLGLSVLWATMDIGASREDDDGECYLWGDPDGEKTRKVQNSFWGKWFTGGPSRNNICGDYRYDTATNRWGTPWRMPTCKEFEELSDSCSWEPIDDNHVRLTGPNGNSIVLDSRYHWTGESPSGDIVMFKWFYVNLSVKCGFYSIGSLRLDYADLLLPVRAVTNKK